MKTNIVSKATLATELTRRGFDCKTWTMPHSHGESILQVTILESGPSMGATVYVSPEASLERALQMIESKRQQFHQSEQTTK